MKVNDTFRQADTEEFASYNEQEFDYKTQSKVLSEAYLEIADAAQRNLNAYETDVDTIAVVLDHSNQAVGEMQVKQAHNQLEAISSAMQTRRNALLANLTNLIVVSQAQKMDEAYKEAQIQYQSRLGVVDPYNKKAYETVKEQNNYKKPEAVGMPNFK